MEIGTKIKKRRKELGLTQAQLAEPDFTRGFISQIENDFVTKPPIKTLEILANKLAISVGFLLGEENESSIQNVSQNHVLGKIKICKRLIHLKRFNDALSIIESLENTNNTENKGYIFELKGSFLYVQGRYQEATPLFQEAVIYLNTVDHLFLSEIYQKLADCYMNIKQYDNSIDCGFYGLITLKKSEINSDLLELKFLYILSYCHCRRNEFKQGLQYIKKAVSISQSKNIFYNYGSFKMLQGLGHIYLKEYKEGINHTNEAVEFLESVTDIIGCLTNLGILHRHLNEYDKSEHCLKESLSKARKEELEWHIQNNLYELSLTNLKAKNSKNAKLFAEDGLYVSKDKNLKAKILFNLGCIHLFSQNFNDAYSDINQALNIFEQLQMEQWKARALSKLAEINYKQGDYESAYSIIKKTIKIYDSLTENN